MGFEKLVFERISKITIIIEPVDQPFTPIITEYREIEVTQTSLNNFTFQYGGYTYAYLDFKTCASKIDSLLFTPTPITGRVGIYGGYGGQQNVGSYPIDLDSYFIDPLNPFNFVIIQLETPFKMVDSSLNKYFQQMQIQGRTPYLRLYWGGSGVPIDTAKAKIQAMISDVDLSLIGGFVLGDDVNYLNDYAYYNELYDWIKETYGKMVIQNHAPLDYTGEIWDPSWKADAWEFYNYWLNYDQLKSFINEYREKQGSKPMILLLYYAIGSDSAYSHTPDQVKVAQEMGLDIGIFSFDSAGIPGWWSEDQECIKRFNETKALLA